MKNILRIFSAIGFALAAIITGLVVLSMAKLDAAIAGPILIGLFALVGALTGWYRVK